MTLQNILEKSAKDEYQGKAKELLTAYMHYGAHPF